MSIFTILHVSDPHFGGPNDLARAQALLALAPDLEPDLVAVTGDLTSRARHGEFQAAQIWVRELARLAPAFVIPGDHDLEWWKWPLVPLGWPARVRRFESYFGSSALPTLQLDGVTLCAARSSHGLAWSTVSPALRQWPAQGHLSRREIERVRGVLTESPENHTRVLVLHHNVLRGERTGRMGLHRWPATHRLLMQSGADLILCGHDPQSKADVMGGIVISCAGTVCSTLEGDAASFHRITLRGGAIQIDAYKWDADREVFFHTDMRGFSNSRNQGAGGNAVGVV